MYTEPVRPDDDVYSVNQFLQYVEEGLFIDYDGFGHPAVAGMLNPVVRIKPSRAEEIPADATHIVWYNR